MDLSHVSSVFFRSFLQEAEHSHAFLPVTFCFQKKTAVLQHVEKRPDICYDFYILSVSLSNGIKS